MTLSEVAVKRPVFITMVTAAIMVMGVTGYSRLKTDLYPDVTFPFVSVTILAVILAALNAAAEALGSEAAD